MNFNCLQVSKSLSGWTCQNEWWLSGVQKFTSCCSTYYNVAAILKMAFKGNKGLA